MLQDWARQCYGTNTNIEVVPFLGYSDETSLSIGGQNFHPVQITLALPGKLSRGRYAHQRIALLPVITTADLGLGEKDLRYAPLLAMERMLAVGQLMAALPRHGCCCIGNCQACSRMTWMTWSLLSDIFREAFLEAEKGLKALSFW